jgi:hypothetical protein
MARESPTSVISHWHHLFEGFQVSSMAFYAALEQALEPRNIPDAGCERITYQEAGRFSAQREYLRVTRARLVFDVCAAPFGNGFFVSWWLTEVRASAVVPTILALLAMGVSGPFLLRWGGILATLVVWGVAFVAIGAAMSQGEKQSHAHLLAIPVLGWLWERLFLPETYYRMDTALMFQEAVRLAVHEVVDNISKAEGLRILSPLERQPIMNSLGIR